MASSFQYHSQNMCTSDAPASPGGGAGKVTRGDVVHLLNSNENTKHWARDIGLAVALAKALNATIELAKDGELSGGKLALGLAKKGLTVSKVAEKAGGGQQSGGRARPENDLAHQARFDDQSDKSRRGHFDNRGGESRDGRWYGRIQQVPACAWSACAHHRSHRAHRCHRRWSGRRVHRNRFRFVQSVRPVLRRWKGRSRSRFLM